MKKVSNIAWHLAPTETFEAFKKWHKLACNTDILSAEDRWKLKPKKA